MKRKKSKRPPPPKVPPPMQFQEEDADLNTIGEREEALNPFTSVERVVSVGNKKKKEVKPKTSGEKNVPTNEFRVFRWFKV